MEDLLHVLVGVLTFDFIHREWVRGERFVPIMLVPGASLVFLYGITMCIAGLWEKFQ